MKRTVLVLLGLGGTVLAGCGSSTAQPSAPPETALAVASANSICGLPSVTGRGVHSISPGIRVSLLSYSAMYSDASDSSASAAATIQNGRDAFALGNTAGAESEFQAALGLLRTSQRRVQPLAVPSPFARSTADSTRACRLYVKAIEEYRRGIAQRDSTLISAGDLDMKRASALAAHSQNEAQPAQNIAGSSITALADRAVSLWNARAARERSAYLRSQRTVVLAASIDRSSAGASVRAKHTASKLTNVTGNTARSLTGINTNLLYEPNIGTMEHWIADSTVPWQHYPYAQPVNGLKAILRYPGGGAGTYAAPIPVHRLNYAVEARIRLIQYDPSDPQKADQYPTDGFGIFIRSNTPVDLSGHTPGLMGGVVRIAPPQTLGPAEADYSYAGFTPINSALVPYDGYARFRPAADAWHTYRIEVRGEQITLLIDGLEAAQRTTNAAFLGSRVGIFSVGSEIEVSDFKVLGL